MPISSEEEFKGRRRVSPEVERMAYRLQQQDGGDRIEDYYEEAERIVRKNQDAQGFEFKDDDLRNSGFNVYTYYRYTNANGELLYKCVRYENPNVPGAKFFRQIRTGKDGKTYADAGLVKVPYRWPDLIHRPNDTVYFTEGEKDADRLHSLGLLATTVAGQKWSPEAAKALKGREVIILGDNDDAGRMHVENALNALRGFAARVSVVDLPGLGRTEDVSDWLDQGHTAEELQHLVLTASPSGIRATATTIPDPKTIPPRQWLYKPEYARQFVSLLLSNGGIGKSSLVIAEALAMVTGKPILGVAPAEKLRVWYWNGEDPIDELHRRFAAVKMHYNLGVEAGRLFVNSGRDTSLIIAEETQQHGIRVNRHVVDELIATVKENAIDVVIVDPFVSSHRVNENINGAVDLVAKAWNEIAEVTNCAVLLVHHTRKPNGTQLTVDDGRGASALLNAARSARALNTMTAKEATECGIPERERRRHFSSENGKSNLSPPPEGRTWYRLESVDLGNAFPFGDAVGVVTPWCYPKLTIVVTENDIQRALEKIKAGGPWRANSQVKKEPWIGKPIAEALLLNLADPADKKKIERLVNDWLDSGILETFRERDVKREIKTYVRVAATPKNCNAPD